MVLVQHPTRICLLACVHCFLQPMCRHFSFQTIKPRFKSLNLNSNGATSLACCYVCLQHIGFTRQWYQTKLSCKRVAVAPRTIEEAGRKRKQPGSGSSIHRTRTSDVPTCLLVILSINLSCFYLPRRSHSQARAGGGGARGPVNRSSTLASTASTGRDSYPPLVSPLAFLSTKNVSFYYFA
jgi:hypothetical protein